MLSQLDCAKLCQACYNAPDIFDRVVFTSDVWAGIKHYDDCSAIAFRGSTTLNDWLRDFRGWMINDPQLGMVEDGFMAGLRDVLAHLVDEIEKPEEKNLFITGHSLGAAEALLFGALIQALGYGKTIHSITVFGSPRPAGAKVKEILAPITIFSYRNGTDPVTEVPLRILDLEPYMHPRDLISVNYPAALDDPWGLMAPHHIDYYIGALGG